MVTLSAKVITLATAFTALIPLPTFAAASLLRCQAKDAINLQDDGTLARDRMAEASKADSYIVDLATGMVRQIGIRPVQWIVASGGDEKNDTVLVRVTSSKGSFFTASAGLLQSQVISPSGSRPLAGGRDEFTSHSRQEQVHGVHKLATQTRRRPRRDFDIGETRQR